MQERADLRQQCNAIAASRADIFCGNVVAGDIRMQAVEIMRISDHRARKNSGVNSGITAG
jgi:hypothetical protein